MSELLPCPFCGVEGELCTYYGGGEHNETVYMVMCDNDDCPINVLTPDCLTEAGAIAAWNSRVKPPCGGGYCPLCGAAERTCRNLDKHYSIMFKCSECGHWECQDFDGEKILPQTWNYCPNCGAKVIGG